MMCLLYVITFPLFPRKKIGVSLLPQTHSSVFKAAGDGAWGMGGEDDTLWKVSSYFLYFILMRLVHFLLENKNQLVDFAEGI